MSLSFHQGLDMARVRVLLHQILQNAQDLGSSDEYMISRVYLDFEVSGRVYPDCFVDVKQTVGATYEDGPFEVGTPGGYDGPMNREAFAALVERYYRNAVGANGRMIRVAPGAGFVGVNNRMIVEQVDEFEADSRPSKAGW